MSCHGTVLVELWCISCGIMFSSAHHATATALVAALGIVLSSRMSSYGIGNHSNGIIFALQAKKLGKIDIGIDFCCADGSVCAKWAIKDNQLVPGSC